MKKNIKKYLKKCRKNLSQNRQSIIFVILYFLMVFSAGYLIYLINLQKNQMIYISSQPGVNDFHTDYNFPIYIKDPDLQDTLKLSEFDFESDNSYQKYVDPQISFTEKSYIPKDLRTLSSNFIIDTRGDLQLRDTAAKYFEKLAEAFYKDMGEKIVIVSSYRSYERQRQIKQGGCPDHLCAKAGYSEHQSGLAVDVWSASTQDYWNNSPRLMKFYDWLYDNAHIYGYHNSYQNGVDIDGYAIEPWHWRYLGSDLAKYLHKSNQTFSEFYYSLH